jgi:hypothetical protein
MFPFRHACAGRSTFAVCRRFFTKLEGLLAKLVALRHAQQDFFEGSDAL